MNRDDLDGIVDEELAHRQPRAAHARVKLGIAAHGPYAEVETSTHGDLLLVGVTVIALAGVAVCATRDHG